MTKIILLHKKSYHIFPCFTRIHYSMVWQLFLPCLTYLMKQARLNDYLSLLWLNHSIKAAKPQYLLPLTYYFLLPKNPECKFREEWKSKIPNAFAFGIFVIHVRKRTGWKPRGFLLKILYNNIFRQYNQNLLFANQNDTYKNFELSSFFHLHHKSTNKKGHPYYKIPMTIYQ